MGYYYVMGEASRGFKIGSIIWAIIISGVLIFFVGSILLPSTKRARINFDELRQNQEDNAGTSSTSQQAAP